MGKEKKHRDYKPDKREHNEGSPGSRPASLKLVLKVGSSPVPEPRCDTPPAPPPAPPTATTPAVAPLRLNVARAEAAVAPLRLSRAAISEAETQHKERKHKKKKKKEKDKHKHKKDRRQQEGASPGPDESRLLSSPDTHSQGTISSPEPSASQPADEDEPAAAAVTAAASPAAGAPPLRRLLEHLLRGLRERDTRDFFGVPVTDDVAPGYSSIIDTPMDFSTIAGKVEKAEYPDLGSFKEDFRLMCCNAMTYNRMDTIYYRTAKRLLHIGSKMMSSDKVLALRSVLPYMAELTPEVLGIEADLLADDDPVEPRDESDEPAEPRDESRDESRDEPDVAQPTVSGVEPPHAVEQTVASAEETPKPEPPAQEPAAGASDVIAQVTDAAADTAGREGEQAQQSEPVRSGRELRRSTSQLALQSAQKCDPKSAQKVATKPAEKPDPKIAQRSDLKPAQKADPKPAQKSDQKSDPQPAQRPELPPEKSDAGEGRLRPELRKRREPPQPEKPAKSAPSQAAVERPVQSASSPSVESGRTPRGVPPPVSETGGTERSESPSPRPAGAVESSSAMTSALVLNQSNQPHVRIEKLDTGAGMRSLRRATRAAKEASVSGPAAAAEPDPPPAKRWCLQSAAGSTSGDAPPPAKRSCPEGTAAAAAAACGTSISAPPTGTEPGPPPAKRCLEGGAAAGSGSGSGSASASAPPTVETEPGPPLARASVGDKRPPLAPEQTAPSVKMGFLRRRVDGTTSLAILTPSSGGGGSGGGAGRREGVQTVGQMSGRLSQGTTHLPTYRDDKRSIAKPVKPLYYGAYSSFAPCYDSTFANISLHESELLFQTLSGDSPPQLAHSVRNAADECDVAIEMVDNLLDVLTDGQHRRTEVRLRAAEERAVAALGPAPIPAADATGSQEDAVVGSQEDAVDFSSLRSLSDLGIDVGFLDELESDEARQREMQARLDQTSQLLSSLNTVQLRRLSQPPEPTPPQPSHHEIQLADDVTSSLVEMVRQAQPADVVVPKAIRNAMGVGPLPPSANTGPQRCPRESSPPQTAALRALLA